MMVSHARFGFAVIDGDDDDAGNVWYQIGLIQDDESVPGEVAVVMLRNADESERRFPGITKRKINTAKIIAEALTEYAERHSLADAWFHLQGMDGE